MEYFNAKGLGKDKLPIGRWVYMKLKGSDGIETIILSGYCPCYNKRPDTGTSYQQHRRYYINEQDKTCPRVRFRKDLIKQLKDRKD